MFGFPTQVRYLFHKRPNASAKWPPEEVVDRPLDLAISQFAPGSETVKEALIHTAVGVVRYQRQGNQAVEMPNPLGPVTTVGLCTACQSIRYERPSGSSLPGLRRYSRRLPRNQPSPSLPGSGPSTGRSATMTAALTGRRALPVQNSAWDRCYRRFVRISKLGMAAERSTSSMTTERRTLDFEQLSGESLDDAGRSRESLSQLEPAGGSPPRLSRTGCD